MEAISAASTPANDVATMSALDFGPLTSIIRNGHFEFKANGKILIPETSNEVFVNHYAAFDATTDKSYAYALTGGKRFGEFKLDNPKLIETQVPMEFNIEWGTACTAKTCLKVVLVGTRVIKH